MNLNRLIEDLLYDEVNIVYMTATKDQAQVAFKKVKEHLEDRGWVVEGGFGRSLTLLHTGAWIRFGPCVLDGAGYEHAPVLILEDEAHMEPKALAEAQAIPAPGPTCPEPLIVRVLR